MSQQELLIRVVEALNGNGIEYMITGSTISSLQGEPRLTHDVDIVVRMVPTDVDGLVKIFPPPDYYLDDEAAREAIRTALSIRTVSLFNLIVGSAGDKADFWPLTPEPFDQSRFQRRQTVSVLGIEAQVSSPEDTILAKLNWAMMAGGSEKQFSDALRVYEVQYTLLDMHYLKYWVTALELETLWQRLQNEAETL